MKKGRVTLPLAPELPARYFDMGKRETWEKGEGIFRPEPATGLYLLLAGHIRLIQHYTINGNKRNKLLFTISPPGLVFEARCIIGVNPDLEAIVTARAETTYLDIESVERFMNDDPVFHAFLTYTICYKEGVVVRTVLWGRTGQTTEALLDLLQERAAAMGKPTPSGRVRLPIDRAALGEDLGVHLRTLIRCLNTLEKNGEIELWRGGVTLLKPGHWNMTQVTRDLVDRVAGNAKRPPAEKKMNDVKR